MDADPHPWFSTTFLQLDTGNHIAGLALAMAKQAGVLICCQSRCTVPRLEPGPVRGLQLAAHCLKCGAKRGAPKGIFIATEELAPLFKLIGELRIRYCFLGSGSFLPFYYGSGSEFRGQLFRIRIIFGLGSRYIYFSENLFKFLCKKISILRIKRLNVQF